MKRVNYVFNIATNLDEDADLNFLLEVQEKIRQIMSDYTRPEKDFETKVNGKVNVSIDTTQVEINSFGDLRLYGYLICNDDVEKIGISNWDITTSAKFVYEWFRDEIIDIIEYILRPHCIKADPDITDKLYYGLYEDAYDDGFLTVNDEGGRYLDIYSDDVKDLGFLDGCIDDIDDYEE